MPVQCKGAAKRIGLSLLLGTTIAMGQCDAPSASAVRIVWTVPLSADVAGWQGMPAIADGLVITEHGSALRAYDQGSGTVRWTTNLRANNTLGAQNVAVAGGRAFVATADSIFAVSLGDGQRLWAFLPDAQAALCEIAAVPDAVFVGTRSHRVYRLDATTGAVVWSVDIGPDWSNDGFVDGLSTGGDTLFVSATEWLNASGGLRTAHVLALQSSSGVSLWHYVGPDSANDAQGAPRISGDNLLVSNNWHNGRGGSIFALDRRTGTERWRTRFSGLGPTWPPVVDGVTAYGGGWDGLVLALTANGTRRWQANLTSSVSSVALCGGLVLANTFSLIGLDAANGNVVERLFEDTDRAFLTSGIATSGSFAFVVGNRGVYGISCRSPQ